MTRAVRSTRIAAAAASALVFSLASLSTPASAAEFTRTITIARIAGVSTSRPSNPSAQSVIRVFATAGGAWGSSTCRPDAADVSMDDWHIYAIVMRAWKDAMPLQVVVESTQVIDTGDSVCKIVAVNPAV